MEPRSGTCRKLTPRCIVNYSTLRRPAIDAYLLSADSTDHEIPKRRIDGEERLEVIGATRDSKFGEEGGFETPLGCLFPKTV